MIRTASEQPNYKTLFTNARSTSLADTTSDKGGSDLGFRPHELLEAAFACCMNMSLRMFAEEHSIPLSSASTTVSLDRSRPDEACFGYSVELSGDLSDADREDLLESVKSCPVRQTLSKKLTFREAQAG
jgi:putative redox protein